MDLFPTNRHSGTIIIRQQNTHNRVADTVVEIGTYIVSVTAFILSRNVITLTPCAAVVSSVLLVAKGFAQVLRDTTAVAQKSWSGLGAGCDTI